MSGVDELPAGPETDLRIAQEVLGWTEIEHARMRCVPLFTYDWRAMELLVEWLSEQGWNVTLNYLPAQTPTQFRRAWCFLFWPSTGQQVVASAEITPLAVARAAFKAKEASSE